MTRRKKTETVQIDVPKLKAAFKAANQAAAEAAPGDDGGTCNFDTAMLFLPHSAQEQIALAALGTGVRVNTRNWLGQCFSVNASTSGGQGFSRTRVAEAICKALEAAGFSAMVYYQMD